MVHHSEIVCDVHLGLGNINENRKDNWYWDSESSFLTVICTVPGL